MFSIGFDKYTYSYRKRRIPKVYASIRNLVSVCKKPRPAGFEQKILNYRSEIKYVRKYFVEFRVVFIDGWATLIYTF